MKHSALFFIAILATLLFSACGGERPAATTNVTAPGYTNDTTSTWSPAVNAPSANQRVAQPSATTARQSQQESQIVIQEVTPPTYNFLWATGMDAGSTERGNGWTSGKPINEHSYGGYVEQFGIGEYMLKNKSRLLNTNRQPKNVIADILSVTRSLDMAMTWSIRNPRQSDGYYCAIARQISLAKNMVKEVIDVYDQETTNLPPMRNRKQLKDYENLLINLDIQLQRFLDPDNPEYLSFVPPTRRSKVATQLNTATADISEIWDRGYLSNF